MRRVSVVGISGAGKTTLARRLAPALDVPHVELDAIFHQPGWTELPVEEFRLVSATSWRPTDGSSTGTTEQSATWSGPLRTRSCGSIDRERP